MAEQSDYDPIGDMAAVVTSSGMPTQEINRQLTAVKSLVSMLDDERLKMLLDEVKRLNTELATLKKEERALATSVFLKSVTGVGGDALSPRERRQQADKAQKNLEKANAAKQKLRRQLREGPSGMVGKALEAEGRPRVARKMLEANEWSKLLNETKISAADPLAARILLGFNSTEFEKFVDEDALPLVAGPSIVDENGAVDTDEEEAARREVGQLIYRRARDQMVLDGGELSPDEDRMLKGIADEVSAGLVDYGTGLAVVEADIADYSQAVAALEDDDPNNDLAAMLAADDGQLDAVWDNANAFADKAFGPRRAELVGQIQQQQAAIGEVQARRQARIEGAISTFAQPGAAGAGGGAGGSAGGGPGGRSPGSAMPANVIGAMMLNQHLSALTRDDSFMLWRRMHGDTNEAPPGLAEARKYMRQVRRSGRPGGIVRPVTDPRLITYIDEEMGIDSPAGRRYFVDDDSNYIDPKKVGARAAKDLSDANVVEFDVTNPELMNQVGVALSEDEGLRTILLGLSKEGGGQHARVLYDKSTGDVVVVGKNREIIGKATVVEKALIDQMARDPSKADVAGSASGLRRAESGNRLETLADFKEGEQADLGLYVPTGLHLADEAPKKTVLGELGYAPGQKTDTATILTVENGRKKVLKVPLSAVQGQVTGESAADLISKAEKVPGFKMDEADRRAIEKEFRGGFFGLGRTGGERADKKTQRDARKAKVGGSVLSKSGFAAALKKRKEREETEATGGADPVKADGGDEPLRPRITPAEPAAESSKGEEGPTSTSARNWGEDASERAGDTLKALSSAGGASPVDQKKGAFADLDEGSQAPGSAMARALATSPISESRQVAAKRAEAIEAAAKQAADYNAALAEEGKRREDQTKGRIPTGAGRTMR